MRLFVELLRRTAIWSGFNILAALLPFLVSSLLAGLFKREAGAYELIRTAGLSLVIAALYLAVVGDHIVDRVANRFGILDFCLAASGVILAFILAIGCLMDFELDKKILDSPPNTDAAVLVQIIIAIPVFVICLYAKVINWILHAE